MDITELSLYSIISSIAFVAVAIIGFFTKIILRAKRKKVDGLHGFTEQPKDENFNYGWKTL